MALIEIDVDLPAGLRVRGYERIGEGHAIALIVRRQDKQRGVMVEVVQTVRLAFAGEPDAPLQARLAGQSPDHRGKVGRPVETAGAHTGPGQVADLGQRTDQQILPLARGDRPDAQQRR